MQPQALVDRPPYVTFETREIEDRQASIEAGHYVAKDVDFAIICPQGSKDRVDRNAAEWLDHIDQESKNDRFPFEWVTAFKGTYAAWKAGHELPENGVPIKTWPVLSPAQVSLLLNLRIRTVEDLAALNEEGVNRIGMGARSLQQKARDWLASAQDNGKITQELDQIRQANEVLRLQNEKLTVDNKELAAKMDEVRKEMQHFISLQKGPGTKL